MPPLPSAAQRSGAALPLGQTALAVMLMATALALGGLLTEWLGGGRSFVERLLPAVLVSIVVLGAIVLLRRRWDRKPLAGIGLTGLRPSVLSLMLGAAVVLGTGAAVAGGATMAGGIRWVGFDPAGFLVFLAVNTVIALLLEALPEEVSIRGYALTALRSRYSRGIAALLATAAFLALPATALGLQALLSRLTGLEPLPWALAPAGEDALTYYAMLAGFSLLLIFAREATAAASIWTCIGAHLAFLTINRILLGAEGTGIEVELAGPALPVVFGVYLSAAVVVFSILRERAERRRSHPLGS